jgi:small ligand-binding sensory domain FIST
VSLGLLFTTPRFFPHAEPLLEILRVHGRIPLLAGCSSQSLVVGGQEVEENAGFTLGLYSLPGAELEACHFTQRQVEEANGPGYWHLESGVDAEHTNGWLAFLDPFNMDSEGWLRSWNEAYAPVPILGGLASGDLQAQQTQVYLNGDAFDEGGVAVSVGGAVKLVGVISQGCTPIGDTWTLTRVEQNLIQQIANRPAYQVLADTVERLSPEDQRRARGNLFIGLAINEYREEFHRGDFLVRNLLGADPHSGVLAVGAFPRPGQTIQFQRRDARAAQEDMEALFGRAHAELTGATIYGGCLCTCNGRGKHLFGRPNHDAQMVQRHFGPLGLTGFFCNGEIGPVGGNNFLHGYTASLALFVKA